MSNDEIVVKIIYVFVCFDLFIVSLFDANVNLFAFAFVRSLFIRFVNENLNSEKFFNFFRDSFA